MPFSLPRSSLSLLILIAPLLFSCKKEQMGDCLKGKGERVSRERSITGIRSIELYDHVDLRIVIAQDEGVEVRAGKNLLPLIETRKVGDTLRIRDRNTCNWVRSYEQNPEVTVRTRRLLRLENRSTADIALDGTIDGRTFHYSQWNGMGNVKLRIETDTAWLKLHTGAGELRVAGSCGKAFFYNGGPGFIHSEKFACENAWGHNKGAGDIHLRVSKELAAKVEGAGSVIYEGSGDLVKAVDEGKGDIVRKD